MISSLHIHVTEQGQAGEARRIAQAWALEAECGPVFAGIVALVVTELAKNLALHTKEGGSLVVRRLCGEDNCGVSILSLDRGPGVANFGACLRDGYSTAGTAGIGLGGVGRRSHVMEVHSQPGVGTAIYSELWAKPPPRTVEKAGSQAGAVSVPMRGETACGDSWAEQHGAGWSRFLIADGLGHGPHAADASCAAREVFCEGAALALPTLLQRMHEKMRHTRGAAVAVAHLDWTTRQVTYAGVGNIAAAIVTAEKTSNLVSHNGTVGGAMPSQPREFTYPWPADALLLMHSDGLKQHWQLERYAGLATRHPELIAGVLYRDFNRGSDDTTVLAARPCA